MKVQKIDIKSELMEVKDNTPYIKFAVREQINALAKDGEYPNEYASFREKTYLIQKVNNPEAKETEYFAVETDERGLFDKLISISNNLLEQKIIKALDEERFIFRTRHIPDAILREGQRIRKLPWYSRLLNKS